MGWAHSEHHDASNGLGPRSAIRHGIYSFMNVILKKIYGKGGVREEGDLSSSGSLLRWVITARSGPGWSQEL